MSRSSSLQTHSFAVITEVKKKTVESSAFRGKKEKEILMFQENVLLSLEQCSIILFLVLPCAYIREYTRFDFYKYFVMPFSSLHIPCSFDFKSLL